MAEDLSSAVITVTAEVEGSEVDSCKFEICHPNGELVQSKELPLPPGATGVVKTELQVADPALWWPNGNGKQHLYHVTATISATRQTLCTVSKRIGLRRLKLVQNSLQGQPEQASISKSTTPPSSVEGRTGFPLTCSCRVSHLSDIDRGLLSQLVATRI